MPVADKKLQWQDVADLVALEKVLHDFALLTGITSVIMDTAGDHVTKQTLPHNKLCMDLIKGTSLGRQRCDECDLKWGAKAAAERTYKVYTCKNGMVDFVSPIIFEGEVLWYLFGGQVLAEEDSLDSEWHAQNAEELGIDVGEYLEALDKIPVLPRERIEAAARMLHNIANYISTLIARWIIEREEVREREKALVSFRETVAETVAKPDDLQVILQKIVERIAELVAADIVTIHVYDLLTDEVHAAAGCGLLDRKTFQQHKPGRGKAALLVASRGEPVIAEDVSASELAGPFSAREGVQSAAGFPLKVGDEVIGVLFVNYRESHGFQQEEIKTIVSLGNLAAVAINAARAYEEARASAQTIHQLAEVGQSLVVVRDLEQLLHKIAESAGSTLGADIVVLYEYREDIDDVNLPPVVWGDIRNADVLEERGHARPHRQSAVFEVLGRKEPVYASDARKVWSRVTGELPQEERVSSSFVYREAIASSAAVRLRTDGERVGVLFVNYRSRHGFPAEERKVIELFATQAAIAIQNARLYEQRIEDIKAIQAINKAITAGEPSRTTTPDGILQLIVDRLSDAFHAVSCAIRLYDPKLGRYGPRIAAGTLEKKVKFPPRRHGASQHVLEEKEPVYASDTSVRLPNGKPVIREEIQKEGIQSVVYLPLLSEGDVLGILYVEWTSPRQFSQNDRLVLGLFADQTAVAMENARLYNQRRNDIAALKEINEAITIKEWSEIAALIAQKAQELTQAEYGTLWLVDDGGEHLVMEAMYGREAKVNRLPIDGRSINGRVAMTGGPYKGPDVREDAHYAQWYEDVRSNMTVPLRFGDHVIGTLTAESTRLDAFSEYQLGLLQSLADQAAIAIQNARLFNDAQRRIRDLEIINRVGQRISTKLDTQDLLQTIVFLVADQLSCSHCTLFLLQEQNGKSMLVPQVTYGTRDEVMTRRFEPGEGLAGWVFQRGRSLVLADVREDPRFAPYREERNQPRSMLIVPVKVGDQTIGIISADQDEFGWFSGGDSRLVEALALQAGIAIQRATGLELLRDIGNRIISLLQNVDEILQEIVYGATKLTNTSTGVIYLISRDGQSVMRKFHPPGFDHPAPRMDREDGLTRTVIRTGEVLSIPDIPRDPHVNPVLCDRFQSLIAVPLRFQQRVIGVLYLNDEDSHDFTETEVSLLSTLASQAAIAVENAQLFEQAEARLRERIDDIGVLTHIYALMGTAPLEDMLEQIAEHGARLTPANYAEVWLLDERVRELQFGAGISGEETTESMLPLPLNEPSINAHVILTSKTYRCDNVEGDPFYRKFRKDTQSELTTPLIHSGKTVGTLSLESRQVGAFTDDHVRLVESLAGAAAVAIQNARLYEKIRTLNEVGRILTSRIRLREDEVLELIYSQVSRLMNTDNMYIALYNEATDTVRFGLAFVDGRRVEVEKEGDWQPRKAGKGRTEEIICTKKPILHTTRKEADNWYAARLERKEYMRTPFASWLGVPMIVGERVLGVIAVYDLTWSNIFGRDDLEVLQVMASQAAIALQNARLFEEKDRLLISLREEETRRIAAERWQTLGQAATNLAHRMNNLAGIIPVCVQRIRERIEDEPTVAENLRVIEQQAQFLLHLSEHLLRPFAPSTLRSFDVNALVREALAVARPILEEHRVLTSFHSGENIPKVRITGLLSDAFVELITNAAKAMPKGGKLEIETKLFDGNLVEIVFTDTGCGIATERQSRVFGLFGAGREPTKRPEDAGRSIGFGLWWVRTFLQQWDGDVVLQRSEIDKGSTFVIRLPTER